MSAKPAPSQNSTASSPGADCNGHSKTTKSPIIDEHLQFTTLRMPCHQTPPSKSSSRPPGLDFIERYPALDSSGKRRASARSKKNAGTNQISSREYKWRRQPPSEKGTFSSPLRANGRSANYGRQLIIIGKSSPSAISGLLPRKAMHKIEQDQGKEEVTSTIPNEQALFNTHCDTPDSRALVHRHFTINRPSARLQSGSIAPKSSANLARQIQQKVSSPSSVDTSSSGSPSPPPICIKSDFDFSKELFDGGLLDRTNEQHSGEHNDLMHEEPQQIPDLSLQIDGGSTTSANVVDPIILLAASSADQISLFKQGLTAQAKRTRRVCNGSKSRLRQEGGLQQSQSQLASGQRGNLEQDHANPTMVSQEPGIPLLHDSFESGPQGLSSCEEHHEQHIRHEGFDQVIQQGITSNSSITMKVPTPRQSSEEVSRIPLTPKSRSISMTNYGKLTWPLSAHRLDRESTRQQYFTHSDQLPSWKVNNLDEQVLLPLTKAAIPCTFSGTISSIVPSKLQHATAESLTIQAISAVNAVPILEVDHGYEAQVRADFDQNKMLPKLPDDLDTSAIAQSPLSKEVPLPQFVTAENPASTRLENLKIFSTTHDIEDQAITAPTPDLRPVHTASFMSEQWSNLEDDELSPSLTNDRRTAEQTIPDAYVVSSNNELFDRSQQYCWSVSSFEAGRRHILNAKQNERKQSTAEQKQKPSRGCGLQWKWFIQRLIGKRNTKRPFDITSDLV